MKSTHQNRFSKTVLSAMFAVAIVAMSASQLSAQDDVSEFEDRGNGTFKHKPSGLIWLGNPTETPRFENLEQAQDWVANLKDGMNGLADGSEAGDWRLPTYEETVSANDYDFDDALFETGFEARSYMLRDGDSRVIAMWGGGDQGTGGGFGGMDSYRFSRTRTPIYIWPVRKSNE